MIFAIIGFAFLRTTWDRPDSAGMTAATIAVGALGGLLFSLELRYVWGVQ